MGFLDKLRAPIGGPKEVISLEKKNKISLKKEEVHRISLEKTSSSGAKTLEGLKARVMIALDFSGSMNNRYKSGMIQEVLENILPFAMAFDDDGQAGVWLFDDEYRRLPDLSLLNVENYVQKEILANKWHMGRTNYYPVMKDITRVCVEENVRHGTLPAYILFITDGNNEDHAATKKILKDASYNPIFWQYVGIGSETFPFLEKLDDLKDRNVDNANYFKVNEPSNITYDQMLQEFPDWLEYEKVKAMLKR